ncbi:MAG TPA: GTPase Era, partial [Gammaproteobacteria bacterium]|nr:GTPase Era [Gammaproteobacteria bacterium]
YTDTPGLQKKAGSLFNRYMNREIINALYDVDIIVHVVEAMKWLETDNLVYETARKTGKPLILAINKMDRLKHREDILSFIEKIESGRAYASIIPVSARSGDNMDVLEKQMQALLPPGLALFPPDQVTDRSERYISAEFIREKLTRNLGDEIPYNLSVTIEKFTETGKLLKIYATIWVASDSQKKIVIGKSGAVLKKTGEQSRKELEKILGKKVFLQTWVKTRKKWTDNPRALQQFGYENR